MASKMIRDSPALLDETLLPLSKACKRFPGKRTRSTLERHARKGVRGVVLETILICGRRYTSEEAIQRFIRNQLRVEADRPAPPKRGTMSRRDIEAASRRFGLPEVQGAGNSNKNERRSS